MRQSDLAVKPNANLESKIAEFNDIAEQTYYLEQKVYEYNKIIEKNKKKLSEVMGSRNRLDFRVDTNLSFEVTKRVETNIEFFEEQLKKKLPKEIFLKTLDKRIVVADFDGLIKFLRKNGVKPKEFKQYIQSVNTVDSDSVNELLELGEIELKDLHGCYSAEFEEEIKVRKNK